MVRLLAILGLAASLVGCDAVQGAFMSTADKVNAAYPLPEELVTSRNALLGALQKEDGKAHQEVSAQLAGQMELRALACSSTANIGRFDSTEAVKRKVGSPACFREQDAKLADWLGVRRVARVLQRPALVPVAPLPPRLLLPPQKESANDLAIAEAANVVAVRSTRLPVAVMSVPSGKVLSSFDAPPESNGAGALSPNGALLALPAGARVSFVDTESGNTLWKSDKHRQVLAWLPEIEATLLADVNSAPAYLDHRKGTIESYPAIARADWAARLPNGRLLLGSNNQVALSEHARSADGVVTVQALKQWRLERSVSSGRPMLMRNGKKLVYLSMSDLGWLDLDTGEQGVWELRALAGGSYAKLSETQIYLEASAAGSPWQRTPYILDVEKATLTPAEPDGYEGIVIPLTPRSGYARRGSSNNMTIASGATAKGEEKSLPALIADAQLAKELAKLNTPEAGSLPGIAMAPGSPSRIAAPLLAKIPADARVAIVGVYESVNSVHGHGSPRKAGTVRVTVAPGRGPLVLVLSSYEPIDWVVQDGGRPPAAILVSGYYPSTVTGTRAEVHRIGSTHAYKMESAEYIQLKQDVARYVGAPVVSFQGAYSGKEFSVY